METPRKGSKGAAAVREDDDELEIPAPATVTQPSKATTPSPAKTPAMNWWKHVGDDMEGGSPSKKDDAIETAQVGRAWSFNLKFLLYAVEHTFSLLKYYSLLGASKVKIIF